MSREDKRADGEKGLQGHKKRKVRTGEKNTRVGDTVGTTVAGV